MKWGQHVLLAQTGVCTEQSWKSGGHWSSPHFTLYALSWEQAMCMHVSPVDSKLLTALLLVLAAVQPARGGLVFLVSSPRTGAPNIWLKLLTSQG